MTEWFDTVYNDPLYLEFYEAPDSELAVAEAQGAIRLLKPAPGVRWLELCCGFGRHAEAFAEAGHDVTGVDRSAMMLARAKQRAMDTRQAIDYIRADIRLLPFTEAFDCATCIFDSFGYFASDTDHLQALLSIIGALKPRGQLLIELVNRERILSTWSAEITETRPPYTIHKHRRFDFATGRVICDLDIQGPEVNRTWTLDCRFFAASELRNLLEQAGFDQIRFCGDWDGSDLTLKSRALIAVARKATFADLPPLDS